MKLFSTVLTLFSTSLLLSNALPQKAFMTPDDRGSVWSLCDDPASHSLIGYKGGVSISPEQPKTGEDIHVQIHGKLLKDVEGGNVDIDLSIMSMIKIKKQLELCQVLDSDIMGHKSCPLKAGDIELDATAWIPRELPKLPLEGNIRISDQDGNTVTCVHLNFKLQ